MSRATDAALDALHALAAESMSDELRRNLERARQPKMICEDGEMVPNPEYEPLSPKLLGVVRAFLKDNGIDAPASSERFDSIVDQLRDLEPDEIDAARLN